MATKPQNFKYGYLKNGSIIELPYKYHQDCVKYCQSLLSDNEGDSIQIVEIVKVIKVYKNTYTYTY